MTLTILRRSSEKLKKFFADYKTRVNDNICHPEIKAQLSKVQDLFNRCQQSHDNTLSDALCDPLKNCPPETDMGPKNSVFQIARCPGAMSTTSSKLLARQIDLDCRRAELRAIHAHDLGDGGCRCCCCYCCCC